MSGGGGTNTVQKADPWESAQPYLQYGLGQAQNLYQQNPSSYYPGQTYLPMNPLQQEALNAQLGNVSQLETIGGASQQGLGTLLGAADLQNNPYAQQYATALSRNLEGNLNTGFNRLYEGLTEQVLPTISSNAAAVGQTGSSRQGVAEGIALGKFGQDYMDLTRNLTDQTNQEMANFYSNQYGQGLDAVGRGLGFSPSVAGLTQMPYQSIGQVGDILQQQNMLPLQEAMDRYYYNQQAPWNDLNMYSNLVTGAGGLGSSTTGSSDMNTNTLGTAAGGAMAGYGAASALGSSNPYGWAAMAALAALASR